MDNRPIAYVPGRVIPEVYSGTPTFMGLPRIDDKNQISQHDVVFMGVPWEGICTWGAYSACELTTKVIRHASVRYGGYLPDFDIDVFETLSGGDYGDCAVQSGNYDFTMASAAGMLGDIVGAGKFPVVFGGDHSITFPLVREFAKHRPGRFGLIHFDAHMDNVADFGGKTEARCSPMNRIYDIDGFSPSNMISVGIRGPRNHPDGLKEARRHGASVITGLEAKLEGWQASVKKAIEIASRGTDGFYVTVCSDVLDVANNPGGPPDPCGITTFELAMMLHECGKAGAMALDYVEIYPGTDPGNVSAHNVAWMVIYLLAGVAQRRRADLSKQRIK
jgi:arginase family enzyme